MRQNEPTAAYRLAAPINFYDLDGQLLKNQTFTGASGEVQVYRSTTNDWVNASGNAFELGGANTSGVYGYVFSQAETNYASLIGVRLVKSPYATVTVWLSVDDRRDAVELQTALIRLLGLHRENSVMDGGPGIESVQYEAGVLISARVRVFADKATALSAALGAANGANGEIYRYLVSATVDGSLAESFRLVRDM